MTTWRLTGKAVDLPIKNEAHNQVDGGSQKFDAEWDVRYDKSLHSVTSFTVFLPIEFQKLTGFGAVSLRTSIRVAEVKEVTSVLADFSKCLYNVEVTNTLISSLGNNIWRCVLTAAGTIADVTAAAQFTITADPLSPSYNYQVEWSGTLIANAMSTPVSDTPPSEGDRDWTFI